MAEIKLLQSPVITPALGGDDPAQDIAISSAEITLVADDITAIPDMVRVNIDFTGGTIDEAVNIYIAQGNTLGEVDGNCPAMSAAVPVDVLPNLGVPVPVISQGAAPSRGSGIFRIAKSRLIVVVENKSTAGIAALVVNVTPLNYQSL